MMDIKELIEQAGGSAKVASELGVTRQAVWNWISRGQVGSAHAWTLAKLAKVRASQIRPDVFLKNKNAPAKGLTGATAPGQEGEGEQPCTAA